MKLIHRPIEQWPGEPTRYRKSSNFKAGYTATLNLLEREVQFLTSSWSSEVVIQLALTESDLRLDGAPRAHANPSHPGVIISFETKRLGSLSFSCDRFTTWHDNLRAIALGMEALRKVERYGMGSGAEQYRGWQALPPGTPMPSGKMTADEALRLLHRLSGQTLPPVPSEPETVETAFRLAAKLNHPDVGGDPDVFRQLVEARELLLPSASPTPKETEQ